MAPTLQIVHISDIHMWAPQSHEDVAGKRESIVQLFMDRLSEATHVVTNFIPGLQRDDLGVREDFVEALEKIVEEDEWRDIPTWLVCTGDVTTWGDTPSRDAFHRWIQNEIIPLGIQRFHCLHGNHDYWPDAHPLYASPKRLRNHRQVLRNTRPYNRSHPRLLARHILSNDRSINLYSLSTPNWQRAYNSIALGWVRSDTAWPGRSPVVKRQLEYLKALVTRERRGNKKAVRLVASHHPVASRVYGFKPFERLIDASLIAAVFERYKLADIVMSGHTHSCYPYSPEDLMKMSPFQDIDQLVTGTLSQQLGGEPSVGEENQFQLLRFYENDDGVLMERSLYINASSEFINISENGISESPVQYQRQLTFK